MQKANDQDNESNQQETTSDPGTGSSILAGGPSTRARTQPKMRTVCLATMAALSWSPQRALGRRDSDEGYVHNEGTHSDDTAYADPLVVNRSLAEYPSPSPHEPGAGLASVAEK